MRRLADVGRKLGDLAGAARRLRKRWLLLLGALVAGAMVAMVVLVASGGGSEVSASEFEQVKPGMAQDSVRDLLGDPDDVGSKEFQVSEQTPTPVPTPAVPGGPPFPPVAPAPSTVQTTVEEDDCWFYPVGGETGGQVQFGPGETVQLTVSTEGDGQAEDEAVICFDEAQTVSIASGPFGLSE